MENLIDKIKSFKHICWYPSAGSDYRPFLYFSKAFYEDYSDMIAEPYPNHDRVIPDLFIYTDLNPPNITDYKSGAKYYSDTTLLKDPDNWKNTKDLFSDPDTSIKVQTIERYEGNAFLMKVQVESRRRPLKKKRWMVNLLYIVGENTAAVKDLFFKYNINIETIVQIRYGDGWGGAELKGQWIKALFRHLNTKYYIANARYVNYEEKTFKNDISILREFYAPYDLMTCPELEEIYHTDGNKWSAYGEVKWCKVIMKQ